MYILPPLFLLYGSLTFTHLGIVSIYMLEFLRESIETACSEPIMTGFDDSIPLSGVSNDFPNPHPKHLKSNSKEIPPSSAIGHDKE